MRKFADLLLTGSFANVLNRIKEDNYRKVLDKFRKLAGYGFGGVADFKNETVGFGVHPGKIRFL